MSTKDDILSRIRSHTGTRYEKPEITLDAITSVSYTHLTLPTN